MMLDAMLLQMSPWQAQIVMLPVRRPDPDAKRKSPGQAARADGCRQSGEIKRAKTISKLIATIRRMPGIPVAELAGQMNMSNHYTRVSTNLLIDDGTVRVELGKNGVKTLYLETKQWR
jgi:hypothetical protein